MSSPPPQPAGDDPPVGDQLDPEQATHDLVAELNAHINLLRRIVFCPPDVRDRVQAVVDAHEEAHLIEVRACSHIPAGQIYVAKASNTLPTKPPVWLYPGYLGPSPLREG